MRRLDRTGLAGTFDVELSFTPEGPVDAPRADGDTLQTAVRDQLGLRLTATRGPVEVIVIDSAEKPTDQD